MNEARHGHDYLLKLYVDGEFVMQVGSSLDHDQADRLPEGDTLTGDDRPARTAKVAHYMALVSAALATGARVFESADAAYAELFLTKSEEIWPAPMRQMSWIVDHNRDYATMEATIFGQAVTLYMLSSLNARQADG